MSEKSLPGWVKPTLELGPLLVFFAAYFYWRNDTVDLFGQTYDGLLMATIVFIPVVLVATLALWALRGQVSGMQVLTAVIVLVLGGLTIWFNDKQFIQMKPTMIYLAMSAILVFGILNRRSYLETLLGDAIPMLWEGWMILTRRIAILFALLALLNEGVWRFLGDDIWVVFKTFGLPILTILFFVMQAGLFRIYEDETSE
ncbi:MAG: septation protein IspZ, partial [Pseudomonadota bacterium]